MFKFFGVSKEEEYEDILENDEENPDSSEFSDEV
jgi:hypothetical protein